MDCRRRHGGILHQCQLGQRLNLRWRQISTTRKLRHRGHGLRPANRFNSPARMFVLHSPVSTGSVSEQLRTLAKHSREETNKESSSADNSSRFSGVLWPEPKRTRTSRRRGLCRRIFRNSAANIVPSSMCPGSLAIVSDVLRNLANARLSSSARNSFAFIGSPRSFAVKEIFC